MEDLNSGSRGETYGKTLHFISRLACSTYTERNGDPKPLRVSYSAGKDLYKKWWDVHLPRLIKSGVVETKDSWRAGSLSKGYRISEAYRFDPLVIYEIRCPKLMANVERSDALYKALHYTPLHWALERDLKAFQLNPSRIPAIIEEVSINHQLELEAGEVKVTLERRLSMVRATCHKLVSGELGLIKRSLTNDRLNHILTSSKREIKMYGTLYGEEVACVDLCNSQPLLIASMFPDVLNLVNDAVSGRFYEELMKLSGIAFRNLMKEDALGCLYRHEINGVFIPWRESDYKRKEATLAIEERYPSLLDRIDQQRLKSGKVGYFPIRLQKLEAKIFIDGILSQAQARGIPAIPIHDSLLVRISDAQKVKLMIENEVKRITGLEGKAKVDFIKHLNHHDKSTKSPSN